MSNNSVEYILSLKDKFSSGIKSATTNTEKLNKAVNVTQKSLSNLGGALGIGLGAAGVVSFGKAVVDSLVNYEYFSTSLRTLMKGNAQAAKALENQLVETAKTTPFSLVEVQDATKQLLAYGFSAGSVVKNIRMLGDVASALKIPFADIAYLYGTLKTQGRAFSKDIMQFTGRGIPIVKELAKQFNVTDGEVMKLVEDGKVGFKEVEKAFQSMTTEGGMFFNMMAEQSKTTGGQISMLGDSWEQLKVNIGKSQTGIIAGTVSFANRLVGYLANSFKVGNSMVENFTKYNAQQFTWYESFFESKSYSLVKSFQKFTDAMFSEKPAQTYTQAAEQLRQLIKMSEANKAMLSSGAIDLTDFIRRQAVIKGGFEAVKNQMQLLKTPVTTTQTAAKGMGAASTETAKAKGGTSTSVVESRGVQNFNISIKEFGNIVLNTTNIKEGATQIKETITQALIEAVNDFQLMATK
jgi:tape measure domain-containing protein